MKVTACIPYFGGIDSSHLQCIMELGQTDVQVAAVYNVPYIDQARSIMATKHMQDSDVIVFIDHDMIFKPENVLQLAGEAYARSAVVGAAYCTRSQKGPQVCAFTEELPLTFYDGGSVVKATGLGCGFMAISTSVLELLVLEERLVTVSTCIDAPAYPFFACEISDGGWWGEDLSFCRKCVRHDIGLFLDSRIRVGHKGSYVYHLENCMVSVPTLPTIKLGEKR